MALLLTPLTLDDVIVWQFCFFFLLFFSIVYGYILVAQSWGSKKWKIDDKIRDVHTGLREEIRDEIRRLTQQLQFKELPKPKPVLSDEYQEQMTKLEQRVSDLEERLNIAE